MNHTHMAVAVDWDLRLVVLSYVVAVFASYTALDLAGRVAATQGWARRIWLAGGAFAMGTGIWAMHFTGMQAFKTSMPVSYDVSTTLLSMMIAIAASALALFVVSRGVMRARQLLIAGPIMGVGIASMHYTGMAAMRMPATISYDPFPFALSVVIAIVASMAALWLAFKFSIASNTGGRWRWMKGGSALVMGAAIVGMHYTGMAAANFVRTGEGTAAAISGINTLALGFGIGITTLTILGLALVSSIVDRRFSAQAKELERSERRYESLFRHNPDGVYSLDLKGKFLTANAAAEKITGYRAEDLRQKSFADLVVEEDLGRASDHFERAVRGEAQNYDVAITNEEGLRVELNITNIPIVVDDEVVGIYGIAKDVTERKRAEEARSKLVSIVENSVDAIDSKTLDGTITSVNPAAERLYGYTEEELKGKHISVLTPPERLDEMIESLQRVGRGETISQHESVRVCKDGSRIPVSLTISPLRDSRGDSVGVSAIARDITERKRYEEELRQAKEAAEAASRAKSEFVANLSHEIRTPMNGVIGMTGLLLDTDLSPEQRDYAETIRISGENLLTIINDILDFSKIEAGKMELQMMGFDLQTVVEETVDLLAERTHAKGLELASLIEQGVPTALRGDPGRLTQVLTNLLGNAIKFTEEGEVILRVRLAEESSDAATVRFEVKDTGIGMSEEQCSRIFQSFAQADASTTRRYGGTGLGLAISKQLVEMMEGELGAQSEPGMGSTFWFTARLQKQPEGASRRLPYPSADLLEGLRVLVVDDNETNRKIVHEQVISWGMKNGMAQDGAGALKMLRSAVEKGAPYDLAILDLSMPGMDGMELAHRIKADPTISSTRLILLTSMGLRGEAEQARRVGFSAYLTKPVRQSRLYDAIVTVMSLPEGEASTPKHETPIITRHSLEEARAHARERLSSRAHVLVAEDNAVNQKVAVRMLERLGYRADVAANGLEAVEALSHIPYAAVLMDVQMPEMDGYEATKEIRRREGDDRHTPVIAMTANAMQGDREKALEAGMDDYVSKPVKPEKLELVLGHWILQRESSETEVTLDERALAGLRELQQEGEPDFVGELIELFLHDAPPQLAALRDAIEEEDADSVERISHTLKGSSGSMGAKTMAEICAELQDVGASGDLSRAPELFGRLEEEFGRVRAALEEVLARSRG
jgi:two-component system sensor histidine kinase/response regulator